MLSSTSSGEACRTYIPPAAQADPAPLHAAAASPQATVRARAQCVLRLLGADAPAGGGISGARAPARPAPVSAPDLAHDLLGGDLLRDGAADGALNPGNPIGAAPPAGTDSLLGGLSELEAPMAAQPMPPANSLFAGMALAGAPSGAASASTGSATGSLLDFGAQAQLPQAAPSAPATAADPFAGPLTGTAAQPMASAQGMPGGVGGVPGSLFGGLALGGGSNSAPDLTAGAPSHSLNAALFSSAHTSAAVPHAASVRRERLSFWLQSPLYLTAL